MSSRLTVLVSVAALLAYELSKRRRVERANANRKFGDAIRLDLIASSYDK